MKAAKTKNKISAGTISSGLRRPGIGSFVSAFFNNL